MAVPTIFLTRCHADADEENGDADEEGDDNFDGDGDPVLHGQSNNGKGHRR